MQKSAHPLIASADPSQARLTRATVKVFFLDQTEGDPKFPFVTEQESIFWKRGRKPGTVEPCLKRRGKGFPGGGVEDDESENEAAVRECREELGAPEDEVRTRLTGMTWTRVSGWEQHPWILYLAEGKGLEIRRKDIYDEKLVKMFKWNRAGWAHLKELRKSILAPSDSEQRKIQREAGDAWFYTGHLVGLLAMLLEIEREDFFRLVVRQVSNFHIFSRPMLELLVKVERQNVFTRRLETPHFRPDQRLAFRIVKHLISLDQDSHLHLVRERVDTSWRRELQTFQEHQLSLREKLRALYLKAAEEEGRGEEIEEVAALTPEEEEAYAATEASPVVPSASPIPGSPEHPFLRSIRERIKGGH